MINIFSIIKRHWPNSSSNNWNIKLRRQPYKSGNYKAIHQNKFDFFLKGAFDNKIWHFNSRLGIWTQFWPGGWGGAQIWTSQYSKVQIMPPAGLGGVAVLNWLAHKLNFQMPYLIIIGALVLVKYEFFLFNFFVQLDLNPIISQSTEQWPVQLFGK